MRQGTALLTRVHLTAALGFLGIKGGTLLLNALLFPRLRPRPRAPGGPRVSILIPARDEAHNLPQTLPGMLSQGADEVIVLDDGSRDGTAALARSLGARVLTGQPLPPGWFGKPWACQQLGEAAKGDVLIFTDADVRWKAGALGAVLYELSVRRADLLTALPRPEGLTPGARVLAPLVDAVVLCYLPYPLLQTRLPLATTANGQVMAFRRRAYGALGGYACVQAEMLEDTQFARHLKTRGGRVTQALGQACVGVRMYGGYRESLAGFGKNAVGVHLNSRALLVALGVWHAAVYTLPWVLPGRSGAFRALRVAGLCERALVNLVTGRRTPADLAEGLLGPFTPLLALPAYRTALRRRVVWKGREYPQ